MRNKLTVDGEVADKQFPLRTTGTIYDQLLRSSGKKNISINVLLNDILLRWRKEEEKKQWSRNQYLKLKNKQP